MDIYRVGSFGPKVIFSCDKCGQSYGVGETCKCKPNEVIQKVVEVDYKRNKRIFDLEYENSRLEADLKEANRIVALSNLIISEHDYEMERIKRALLEKKGITIEELLKEDEKVENPTRFQLLEIDK